PVRFGVGVLAWRHGEKCARKAQIVSMLTIGRGRGWRVGCSIDLSRHHTEARQLSSTLSTVYAREANHANAPLLLCEAERACFATEVPSERCGVLARSHRCPAGSRRGAGGRPAQAALVA